MRGRAVRLLGRAGSLAGRRLLITGASGGVGHYVVELTCAAGADVTAVTAKLGCQDENWPHDVLLYNTPGRLVSVHPGRGTAMAAFIFRDTGPHRRLLTAAFADAAWRTPELLERARTASDLYFDSVSQVRMPEWSAGRVALVDDAASCLSLLGDGSSLAMVGAATLAEALGKHRDDHAAAFRHYQASQWRAVDAKLRLFDQAARVLIPATRHGIAARNLATRLWPVAAVASRAGRLRPRSRRPAADLGAIG